MLQAFLTIVALGASALSARYFFKTQFIAQVDRQLSTVLSVLSQKLPPAEQAGPWCADSARETSYRISWRSISGEIYCDSAPSIPGAVDEATEARLSRSAVSGKRDVEWKKEAIFVSFPVFGSVARPEGGFEHGKAATSYIIASVSLAPVRQTLHVFDAGLFLVLLAIGIGLCAFSIISSRQLIVPLGQLILKARAGAELESSDLQTSGAEGADGETSDAGEWVELESALNRIQTDLRQKTETLSREREELATLMGAISDAILAVDILGKPLFFNSRFALLFFDQEHRGKQPHLGEIFRTPDVLQAFHAALREGTAQKSSIPLYTRTESTPHYFSLSVAPLRRDVGPVYGAVGIFHDVTELKRAENIRIEFVANVSHELRTPLTAIKGYTDTLRDDVIHKRFDSAEAFLEIVARNVDRLMRLIGDLLDLSSLESGETSRGLNRAPVDTRELTTRVLTQLEGRYREKRHAIETTFGAATVYADSTRIEQVLVNLLENAIKYIPNEGRIVIVWESAKEAVLLRVSDNGPGIPSEHHSRLFERFYRIDKGRSRDMGGTGLGLAIVKHIVQRHNGLIWVNSEIGKGTEFVCQFPLT